VSTTLSHKSWINSTKNNNNIGKKFEERQAKYSSVSEVVLFRMNEISAVKRTIPPPPTVITNHNGKRNEERFCRHIGSIEITENMGMDAGAYPKQTKFKSIKALMISPPLPQLCTYGHLKQGNSISVFLPKI